jgi:hypothetical protein
LRVVSENYASRERREYCDGVNYTVRPRRRSASRVQKEFDLWFSGSFIAWRWYAQDAGGLWTL